MPREPARAPADRAAFLRDALQGIEPAALASERGPPVPGLPGAELRVQVQAEGSLRVRIDSMMLRHCLDDVIRHAVQAVVGSRERSGPGRWVIVTARREGSAAFQFRLPLARPATAHRRAA